MGLELRAFTFLVFYKKRKEEKAAAVRAPPIDHVWSARRSNQWIFKEISPEYSLQGLMLKLECQYFGHLIWTVDSLEKSLILGKIESWKRRERHRMRWLNGITDSKDMSLSNPLGVGDGQGGLVCCDSRGCKESDTTEQLNWTELKPR